MKNKVSVKTIQQYFYSYAGFFLLLLGAFLRIHHYLENRSLWLDEAYVALELSVMSVKEIFFFLPFSGAQAAPPMLFLLVEKIMILAFGNTEAVLRVFPLFCSLGSLPLFYLFCKRFIKKGLRTIAIAVFALSGPLLYYAAEVKPYSIDVFFTLGLLILYSNQNNRDLSFRRFFLWAMIGSIAMLFSYPSIYILAGIGTAWFFQAIQAKAKRTLVKVFLLGAWWGANFLFLLLVVIEPLYQNKKFEHVLSFFDLFPPNPFASLSGAKFFEKFVLKNFVSPLGVDFSFIWILLILLGLFHVFKKDKEKFSLLAVPLFSCLLAALFHKYPFIERFLIFLVPVLIFFLLQGLSFLIGTKGKQTTILKIAVVFLLLVQPLKDLSVALKDGREKEDIRGIMQIFQSEYQKGDAILLNRHSIFGFGYYHGMLQMGRECMPITKISFITEELKETLQKSLEVYAFNEEGYMDGYFQAEDVLTLAEKRRAEFNPRTWVILSHIQPFQREKFLEILNVKGLLKKAYLRKGAFLYLYDLSQNKEEGKRGTDAQERLDR